jgi:uncharacterized protein YehS (DUF1456 family)
MKELIKKIRKEIGIHIVMPRIKYFIKDDGHSCFKPYYSDKVMRVLTKSVCGIHIEFGKRKLHIWLPYKAQRS